MSDLKEYFAYDPDEGHIIRIKQSGIAKPGTICGCVNGQGYIVFNHKGKIQYAHRVAWYLMTDEMPKIIDHIDHDPANNRWVNLRNVSNAENLQNSHKPIHNTSGVTGVCWSEQAGKWRPRFNYMGKAHYLGLFDDIEGAAQALKKARAKYGFHENHGLSAEELNGQGG